MQIKFDIREFISKTDRLLGAIRSTTGTLKPLLKGNRLNEILGKYSERTIRAQRYKPLTKKYAKRKLKQYGQKLILERTNMTRKLFSGESFKLRAQGGGRLVSISLTDPIPRYHQAGAGRLPERHVIEATPEMAEEIAQELNAGIREELKQTLK